MKKYLYILLTICAVVFCGCSKDDDEKGGSLVIDGVNLVGTWAVEDPDEYIKPGYVDELVVFTEKDVKGYYISDDALDRFRDEGKPWNEWGFTYSNGYLYGCTMRDFDPEGPAMEIHVDGGKLYAAGFDLRVKVINEDKLTYHYVFSDREDDNPVTLLRVKGFK